MAVLITGGAGYIGSTVASACLDAGIVPIVLDDFSTGAREFVDGRISYEGDVADRALLETILDAHPDVEAVIHCAARIVVPESVADPLGYYDANVGKTISMLRVLAERGIDRVVFSSSAAIYAADDALGIDEAGLLAPQSPYARTKAIVEQMLADAAAAGQLRALALRYFNPIGADPTGRTGMPSPAPSHALGRIIAAYDAGAPFTLTGVDWPTRDGSGLRDFIHVWDLARAHVKAVQRFDAIVTPEAPFLALNVGGGEGTTVRELIAAFTDVTGAELEVVEGPRRPGDVAGAYAVVARAHDLLNWRAELTVRDGIRDALAWSQYWTTRPDSQEN